MVTVDIIFKYFPNLDQDQKEKFERLYGLYKEWNDQINVVSRKDFDFFYERHVLHSLGIVKLINFKIGTDVLDVGTGGGFPGIPLAIMFPETNFFLVDSIGKKIKVVKNVIESLELQNAHTGQKRAEELDQQFDFVVSRAVTQLPNFIPWVRNKFKPKGINGYPNGIFYLKGGDLSEELSTIPHHVEVTELSDFFDEAFFETKKVVYISMVQ